MQLSQNRLEIVADGIFNRHGLFPAINSIKLILSNSTAGKMDCTDLSLLKIAMLSYSRWNTLE